jgi:hypothetical protein
MSNDDYQLVQKDCPDNVCAACRRPILRGHRIQPAYICLDNDARNPERLTERGLELGTDYLFCHARCNDPYLKGKRVDD